MLPSGTRILLAVSGGPDSIALLHLVAALAEGRRWELIAGHFDHGIRPEGQHEARQVVAWTGALGIPCRVGRPSEVLPPRQAPLRAARYAFLHDHAMSEGAERIATAHHADDQAETVLFRILRGTGVRGLAGIPERRGIVVRPLLGFWREELEGYLHERAIPFLTDPSNTDPRWARAVIRTRVLPALEAAWDGPVRERLVQLSWSARRADRALLAQAREALRGSGVTADGPGFRFVREGLAGYHPAVQARALAHLAEGLGVRLSGGGTRVAVEFIEGGRSGTSVDVGGGLELSREFDELRLAPAPADQVPGDVRIAGSEPGQAELQLAGQRFNVRWSVRARAGERAGEPGDLKSACGLPLREVRFPLEVRGWWPGDRIRLQAGSRKLKRLFGDRRVPLSGRGRVPVVSDAGGRVLWVWGLARDAALPEPGAGKGEEGEMLYIQIDER